MCSSDLASTSDPTTHTVLRAPTTLELTGPTSSTYRETVTFTATISATDGTFDGTVSFSDGTEPIAACQGVTVSAGTTSPWTATCSTADLTAGVHAISATYSGGANYTGSASTGEIAVSQAPTTTTVTSAPNPSVYRETVTFTVTEIGRAHV